MSDVASFFLNCSAVVSSAAQTCLDSCLCVPVVQPDEPAVNYQDNVAVAFLMVTGAGLSTTFGAALVFCNRCVTRTNHKVLGAALGFSSGVMLYVSFAEIMQKSITSFATCDCMWTTQTTENAAVTAATLCFFGGVVVVYVLDLLVHCISRNGHGHSHGPEVLSEREPSFQAPSNPAAVSSPESSKDLSTVNVATAGDDLAIEDEMSSGDEENNEALKDPEHYLDMTLSRAFAEGANQSSKGVNEQALFDIERQMARRMQDNESPDLRVKPGKSIRSTASPRPTGLSNDELPDHSESDHPTTDRGHAHTHGHGHSHGNNHTTKLSEEDMKEKLNHMGLMTALAIGLHNFPEGLATFVAALANPKVGGALAVAIAIHNIPEGLCVSIPIYYATGSRMKAFWVAFFSGVTEIIGAALGYGFLMAVMGPAAYAVLFGLVSGMMVTIVVKELLPTAHRYDPHDKVVTLSIFVGMVVMALSLVLFRI